MIDRVARYAPEMILMVGRGYQPVRKCILHPKGTAPGSWKNSAAGVVLEMQTDFGSRFWGFEKAWINSELRAVVQGFDSRCELRSAWEVCHEP